MQNQTVNYCGDKEMGRLLEKAGAALSLSQIYGLMYGGLAAPYPVMPMDYMGIVFGEESEVHVTSREVQQIFENLQSLWSIFSQWDTGTEPIALPDLDYQDDYNGLAERLKDDSSMIEYFIKGLDAGHAAETDFGEGGIKALEKLSEVNVIMHQLLDMIDNEKQKEDRPEKELDHIKQMEELSAQCMADMMVSLSDARMRVHKQMQMMTDESMNNKKVPSNEPCPCGSGKKYKNCCGMVH